LKIWTARSRGPRRKKSTNAAAEVPTAVIVRTPLGISSTYTPGYVGVTGIRASW
jgi:hypothetical protein